MIFNSHSKPKEAHAFLSPSQYSWIRYSDDKLIDRLQNRDAVKEGIFKHEYAAQAISLGRKQAGVNDTLKLYINDAIGYKMSPEVMLYYSEWCFGTADAISYNHRKQQLRIHDLKTGVVPACMDQLLIYAALFFLEYDIIPGETNTELRIYQNDEVLIHTPEVDEIAPIMDKIIRFDKLISATLS